MIYLLLRLLMRLISLVPFCILYVLSDILCFVTYRIVGYRKKVVRKNLIECFPAFSIKEIKSIEKKFYSNFVDTILEACKMGHMSASDMSKRMKFVNIEAVNTLLRQGKSVALYLGHYGNWEWISSMPLHLEKSAVGAQIYHKLSNETFDRIMYENRTHFMAVNVEMHQTARFINRMASENKVCIIGFIADQAPRKKDIHYYVPFLNHSVPVLTGTEKITKHYGFDAWFVLTKKIRRGYYEAEFVHMSDIPDLLPDFELTDIYYRMLEDMICRQPELYLWSHRRFKHATLLNS